MARIIKHIIRIATLLFCINSVSASELPDPEPLAKQYLKDLCTLNEQDFTRKYMLMQADAEFLINEMTASYKKMNQTPGSKFSDSLALRSKVQKLVVRSYITFKEWQHENKIDSSKIVYHSCEFELEKKREIPFYATDDIKIYFTIDTLNYALTCDDFAFLKNKWFGGDVDDIEFLDKNFNNIYDNDHEYDYMTDTVAATYNENDYASDTAVAYSEDAYSIEAEPEVAYSKKQLKIQKKIDSYNRKIDVLYSKQYE